MELIRKFTRQRGFPSPLILIDLGLCITAFLIFTTKYTVFYIHIIFVLLLIGAFFWNFQGFTARSLFWAGGATSAVLLSIWQGTTQPEEMIEIALLSTLLVMVFIIASFRAKAQRELEREHESLKQVLAERQALQEALLHQAFYDKLTGLPNRALLFDRLQHAFLEAVRYQQSISMLFLDLDGFKSVNDRFGHCVGDQLLVEVAKRMLLVVRPEDTVARLGGDEFTILIKNPGSVDLAVDLAKHLLNIISEPYHLGGEAFKISASIGVALSYPRGDQPEDLLRDADHAMYQAKTEGKSKIYVHLHNLNKDE